jgi:hypothetical protein
MIKGESIMAKHLKSLTLVLALCVLGLAPTAAWAQTIFDENTVSPAGGNTGDVLVCESATTCGAVNASFQITDWSGISDVGVFFNSATGPYNGSAIGSSTSFQLFSGDEACGSGFSLCDFMNNYNQLSTNYVAIQENPTGLTNYGGGYLFNSPEVEVVTPEPGTFSLYLIGLVGLGLAYVARKP